MIPSKYLAAPEFHEQFHRELLATDRWNAFAYIYDQLARLHRPVGIVETGCARLAGNWIGDGDSTVVWAWIAKTLGGLVTSYDISPDSCKVARYLAPTANVVQMDSIKGLETYPAPDMIDFLYLDSMDYDGDPSALHHLAELGAVWNKLQPGTIIAIDDNLGGGEGKHKFVMKRLAISGIDPVVWGRVVIWHKPIQAPSWEEMTDNEANYR
jgi:hypothetical protein